MHIIDYNCETSESLEHVTYIALSININSVISYYIIEQLLNPNLCEVDTTAFCMSINCFKCNQLLVRERRQCSTCLRQFHPSCSRAYLSTRTANICCLKHLSAIMPQDAQLTSKQLLSTQQLKSSSSRSLSSSDTSLTTLSNVSPASPLSSLEVNLNAFIAQQTQFNNHLSDVLSKQAASLNEQTNELNDQNNKLNDIKRIAKSVAEHQVKIKKL